MSTTAALMPGHMFTSYSGPDGHWARCECGHELDWDTRDTGHARHLLAVAWQAGREALALDTIPGRGPTPNPYEKEN